MADMIARLKVESSEYDSKIQRAAKGIQHLAEACHNAGGQLNVLEDENREYIQSLGNMTTVATTTRGKIAELTSAFIDIKSVYNSLSQEEKNGEVGKELNKQLDIMKGRIQEGKRELADINNEINGGGGLTGALDNLAGKFGMNIKQLAGWGTALTAAKGALDVAKDAFFNNEQQLDEWGRTVQASESLYQGFLNALNNTDISGFLTRMDDIVSAARDAYNALDDLNTYSAFNQRNEMKERAGYTKALDEYKLNPTADNKKTLADANKAVIDGLRETQQKTEDAYMAALRQIATERLNDKKLQAEFVKVFSEGGRNALADAKIGYSQGKMLNAGAQYWYGDRVYDGRIQDRSTGKWRDMSQQEKQNFEFARALSQVNDSQIKEVQALGKQSQAIADQIYQQDRAYNRMAGNNGKVSPGSGGGGGKGGNTEVVAITGSIDEQTKKVQELQKAWRAAADDNSRQKIKAEIEEQQYILDRMTGKEKFDPSKMQQITDLSGRTPWATPEQLIKEADVKLPLKLEIVDTTPLTQLENELKRLQEEQNIIGRKSPELWQQYQQQINATKGKISDFKGDGKKDENDFDKFLGNSSKVVSGLNSVASGLQQMGIKLPEGVQKTLGVIQGLMSVIQGVNTIISVFSTSAETANTVAVTGNTVAMTALTAAVAANTAAMSVNTATNFIPFFAQGGLVHAATGYMVPGNDHADRTLIAASSGELILNRAQQGVIAGALEGGAGRSVHVTGHLEGETIVLAADRYGRRTGKGELAFWK